METQAQQKPCSNAAIMNGAHELRKEARDSVRWYIDVTPPGDDDSDEQMSINLDIDDTLLIELIRHWSAHRRAIMGLLGMI